MSCKPFLCIVSFLRCSLGCMEINQEEGKFWYSPHQILRMEEVEATGVMYVAEDGVWDQQPLRIMMMGLVTPGKTFAAKLTTNLVNLLKIFPLKMGALDDSCVYFLEKRTKMSYAKSANNYRHSKPLIINVTFPHTLLLGSLFAAR